MVSGDVQASVIIILVGIVGLSCLITSLALIYRTSLFRNAFGILCFSQAIGHIGVLGGFVFWAAPTIVWWPSIGDTRLGQEATAVTLFFYYVSIYAHITKGLNRLVSVSWPVVYRRIFSRGNTFVFIGLGWTFSAAHNVPHHIRGCHLFFDVTTWSWTVAPYTCAQLVFHYGDYLFVCCATSLVLFMDVATFVRLRMLSSTFQQNKSGGVMSRSKFRMEARFFVQACTTTFLFATMIVNFYVIGPFAATTKWKSFAFYTVNWELCHALDGLALCIFTLIMSGKLSKITMSSRTSHESTLFHSR